MNNAAYDYYAMCQKDGITAPASNIRFWIMNILKPSCTLMMHHGAILNESLVSNYLGVYGFILKIFSPDIVIGSKGQNWNYSELYLETMHEMAHATHYTRVGNEYWNAFVKYVLFSYVSTGSSYGTGNAEGAGYCEVGEMWAYYMENVVYKDRYDRALNAGSSYWFHPAILEKVEDAGVSRSQICLSLGQDVIDSPSFKSSLQTICPSKKSQIASAFAAYGL